METSEIFPNISSSILAKSIKIPLGWRGTWRNGHTHIKPYIWRVDMQPHHPFEASRIIYICSRYSSDNLNISIEHSYQHRNNSMSPRIHPTISSQHYIFHLEHGFHLVYRIKIINGSQTFPRYEIETIYYELTFTLLQQKPMRRIPSPLTDTHSISSPLIMGDWKSTNSL